VRRRLGAKVDTDYLVESGLETPVESRWVGPRRYLSGAKWTRRPSPRCRGPVSKADSHSHSYLEATKNAGRQTAAPANAAWQCHARA